MRNQGLITILLLAVAVAGCDAGSGARITRDKTAPAPVAARSEPIYYNGKT